MDRTHTCACCIHSMAIILAHCVGLQTKKLTSGKEKGEDQINVFKCSFCSCADVTAHLRLGDICDEVELHMCERMGGEVC